MTSSNPSKQKPRQSLKERLQKPGGITADEAIQKGQEALNETRGDFKIELTQNIAQLTRLYKKKPKTHQPKDEWWREIRQKLHDMRSVAGTYDYALVTVLCDSLLDYFDNVEDDAYFDDIFSKHIGALQRVSNNDIRGKGGPEDRDMVKALRAKVNDRKANAPFKRTESGSSEDS